MGGFLHRIGPVDFGDLPTRSPRHSFRPALNEGANIFNTPRRDAGTEFDWFRVTARLDPGPPSGLTDRNRPVRRDDVGKSQEASGWNFRMVRHGITSCV